MKKIIIAIPLLIIAAGVLVTGCKKSEFEDNYLDPNASAEASIPSLYSALFYNERVMPKYWGMFTFQIPWMGKFSQTSGYTTSERVYEQAVNYNLDRWNYYYTNTIARYRELEKYYGKLTTDADKQGMLLFMETARIFVYDQTAQIVDLWGDIPFSSAGQLNATGNIVLASYDKGKDIYSNILTDLKRISDYLATATPDAFYQTQLGSFDYVNKGNLIKWRKYCNSLILRLAMRVSFENEATAKALVQTILSNPTKYPVVDNIAEGITLTPKDRYSPLTGDNEMREGFMSNPFASSQMIDSIMAPANDPRLAVYFTANKNGEYKGVSNTWNATRVGDSVTAGYFSRWDSTTFSENPLFPGIFINAPEVSFLKAEAYERWGGGVAKDAYETGIKQSVQFYLDVNSKSARNVTKDTVPGTAHVNAYLSNPLIAYGTNNLEKIATQKWLDFGIMQAQHAWAEVRRTKYPRLTFPVDAQSSGAPNPPTRLLYPNTEATLNATNYAAVKEQDKIYTKVFWDVK